MRTSGPTTGEAITKNGALFQMRRILLATAINKNKLGKLVHIYLVTY